MTGSAIAAADDRITENEWTGDRHDRAQLEQEINAAWGSTINASTTGATRDAAQAALGMLDDGSARVAKPWRPSMAGQSVVEEGRIAVFSPE